jgi:hypothetical protein
LQKGHDTSEGLLDIRELFVLLLGLDLGHNLSLLEGKEVGLKVLSARLLLASWARL